MAILAIMPEQRSQEHQPINSKRRKKHQKAEQPSSWVHFKSLLTCKQIQGSKAHDLSRGGIVNPIYTYCKSNCAIKEIAVHGSTRVVNRSDNSPKSRSVGPETKLLSKKSGDGSVRSSAAGAPCSSRGMKLRNLSGCYECHAIVDPSRYPLPRTRVCACSGCGQVFPKVENLEHHQAVRHAVSELGPEDSSRNIVEIIFKSSWLKNDSPICQIERILKVHNTQRTVQRFEDYRDAVKIRANHTAKKNARCAADGNELLRFHCAPLACSLGARGSSSLCDSVPGCGVCSIIQHGFQDKIRTTASSGRAHDSLRGPETRRAMLVCRVIAGRVQRTGHEDGTSPGPIPGSYDSIASRAGTYSNLEELYVFNPRAILPCFVVIYKAMEF